MDCVRAWTKSCCGLHSRKQPDQDWHISAETSRPAPTHLLWDSVPDSSRAAAAYNFIPSVEILIGRMRGCERTRSLPLGYARLRTARSSGVVSGRVEAHARRVGAVPPVELVGEEAVCVVVSHSDRESRRAAAEVLHCARFAEDRGNVVRAGSYDFYI